MENNPLDNWGKKKPNAYQEQFDKTRQRLLNNDDFKTHKNKLAKNTIGKIFQFAKNISVKDIFNSLVVAFICFISWVIFQFILDKYPHFLPWLH